MYLYSQYMPSWHGQGLHLCLYFNPLNAELNSVCHSLILGDLTFMDTCIVSIFQYTGCFKKSFTTLKAYRNLYRGHTQRFELSKCSKTHQVLLRIVIRNCFNLFFQFLLYGTSTVTLTPKSNGPYRSHNNDHYAHD